MKINDTEYGNMFLAPMAGVTDAGFRQVCKLCGADLTCTEMVSSKALIYNNKKTLDLLFTTQLETPKMVQIFGHVPEEMAEVCKMECMQKFDIIDINFGCPAPKIVNNNDGSALLKDLNLLGKIVNSCANATKKPISCKIRIGYNANDNVALDVAKLCEDNGAKMLTIHGRTKAQAYSGEIDYNTIANVKAKTQIKVVGNGNIFDQKSYNTMLSTGVDAVMIGRGALGDPNIFARLKNQSQIPVINLVKKHIQILKDVFPSEALNAYMRKHMLWYLKDCKNASLAKNQICTATNIEESLKILENCLKNQ